MYHKSFVKLLLQGSALAVITPTLAFSQVMPSEADDGGKQTTVDTPIPQNVPPTIGGDVMEMDEIVVIGRALNTQQSIAAKRSAKQIIDTITADQTSRLPDNTIAESLGRIPGVSFRQDGETGNGNYVSIRGLDAALNNVQFDGVNSALATSGARRVPLSGLTADDVAELRVIKSLLPQDEGEGIGGSIQITSRTALERGEDRLRFDVEGRHSEFADKTGYRLSTSGTKLFSENFGINLSASYRKRYIENYISDPAKTTIRSLPEIRDAAGNIVSNDRIVDDIPDEDEFSDFFYDYPVGVFGSDNVGFEQVSYELQQQERDTVSLSGSMDWQATPNTLLSLGGRYYKQTAKGEEHVIGFDNDTEDVEVVNGTLRTVYDDAEIDFGAEIEDQLEISSNVFLRGKTELNRWTFKYQASYAYAEEVEDQFNIDFDTGGRIDDDDLLFTPFTFVNTYFPIPDAAALSDARYTDAIADLPSVLLVDDYYGTLNNQQINNRYALKLDTEYALNKEAFGGKFNSITFGGKFEKSDLRDEDLGFEFDEGQLLNLDGSFSAGFSTGDADGTADGADLIEFEGLFGGFSSMDAIGSPLANAGLSGFPVTNVTALRRLFGNTISDITAIGALDSSAEEAFDAAFAGAEDSGDAYVDFFYFDAQEDLLAAYAQTEFETERLTLTGGVRIEHYQGVYETPLEFDARFVSVFLVDPDDEDSVQVNNINLGPTNTLDRITTKSENTEILPRMNAVYTVNDKFQVRAGAGYSLARPTYYQLGRASEIDYVFRSIHDEEGDTTQVLPDAENAADAVASGISLDQITEAEIYISSGNPNLKNTKALNLDASFEYYPEPSTSLTLGVFHKKIKNFIFVNSESGSGGLNAELAESLLSADGLAFVEQLGGLQAVIDSNIIDDVTIRQPTNGDTATVSGIELGFNHNLRWAPGFLSKVGVNGNITYTDSSAKFSVATLDDEDALVAYGFAEEGDVLTRSTSFYNSPKYTANMEIYYEDDSFEIALSGFYKSNSFDADDDFGLDQYEDDYYQIDLYAEYELPWTDLGDFSVYFEVPDITDGGKKAYKAQTIGRGSSLYDEASFNGREIRLGFRGKF